MQIAVLVNSKSGGGKGLTISKEIKLFLSQHQIKFDIFIDNWPANFNNFNKIWIVGGDGTLNYFINSYPSIQIPIAIIKGGTGNDFAWKLYGDVVLHDHLHQLIIGNVTKVDVGKCNDKYFLNGVGVGFDGEILRSMDKIRWLGGHIGYLIVVIKKIFSFKEQKFEINFNNKILNLELLLMSVFNSSRTGGGFHIVPTADISDGYLNILLCKPLSLFKRLFYLPKIEKGKHLHLPFIHHHLTKGITIKCHTNTAAQIDGELFYAKEFNISIIEKKINFIV
jgi:diacylglycerol kinase (ATP)